MDSELKEAERNFLLAPEDPSAGEKYRTMLQRSGLNTTQTITNLITLMEREIKALLLEELGKVTLPKTGLIAKDPKFEVFEDYSGHLIQAPGVVLSDSYSSGAILTPDGLFSYAKESTIHSLSETGKIRTGSNRVSAPAVGSLTINWLIDAGVGARS